MRKKSKKSANNKNIKYFFGGCNSRECNKKHKKNLSFSDENPATVHTFNTKTKKIKCLECGKITTLSKD